VVESIWTPFAIPDWILLYPELNRAGFVLQTEEGEFTEDTTDDIRPAIATSKSTSSPLGKSANFPVILPRDGLIPNDSIRIEPSCLSCPIFSPAARISSIVDALSLVGTFEDMLSDVSRSNCKQYNALLLLSFSQLNALSPLTL